MLQLSQPQPTTTQYYTINTLAYKSFVNKRHEMHMICKTNALLLVSSGCHYMHDILNQVLLHFITSGNHRAQFGDLQIFGKGTSAKVTCRNSIMIYWSY